MLDRTGSAGVELLSADQHAIRGGQQRAQTIRRRAVSPGHSATRYGHQCPRWGPHQRRTGRGWHMTAGREVEKVLRRLTPLVGLMASERCRGGGYEDARQEGLVAAWRVLSDRPEAPPAYVVAAARNAVKGSLAGRSPFGAPSHQGRREPLNDAVQLVTVNDDGDECESDPVDVGGEAAFRKVETRLDVERALAELDEGDRELIRLRYWEGLDYRESAQVLGRSVDALSRRWRHHALPMLRESLSDLASVA